MIRLRVQTAFHVRTVQDAVAKAERRYLYRSASYVRTTARRSIRKSRKSSKPNQPPKSHVGRLKGGIRFAVEPTKAVIGPIRVWTKNQLSALPGSALLEHGGTITRRARNQAERRKALAAGTNWKLRVGGHGPRKGRDGKTVYVRIRTNRQLDAVMQHIESGADMGDTRKAGKAAAKRRYLAGPTTMLPRPFMGPALKKTVPKLRDMWRGAVR